MKNAINPYTNKQIGRRTGKDIKAGKSIRMLNGGFENFDDYWSESGWFISISCVCVCMLLLLFVGWGTEYLVGSVLCSLSSLMQCRWFDPPLGRIFPVERIFSLGVNMGSDSIPLKLFLMRV